MWVVVEPVITDEETLVEGAQMSAGKRVRFLIAYVGDETNKTDIGGRARILDHSRSVAAHESLFERRVVIRFPGLSQYGDILFDPNRVKSVVFGPVAIANDV